MTHLCRQITILLVFRFGVASLKSLFYFMGFHFKVGTILLTKLEFLLRLDGKSTSESQWSLEEW